MQFFSYCASGVVSNRVLQLIRICDGHLKALSDRSMEGSNACTNCQLPQGETWVVPGTSHTSVLG